MCNTSFSHRLYLCALSAMFSLFFSQDTIFFSPRKALINARYFHIKYMRTDIFILFYSFFHFHSSHVMNRNDKTWLNQKQVLQRSRQGKVEFPNARYNFRITTRLIATNYFSFSFIFLPCASYFPLYKIYFFARREVLINVATFTAQESTAINIFILFYTFALSLSLPHFCLHKKTEYFDKIFLIKSGSPQRSNLDLIYLKEIENFEISYETSDVPFSRIRFALARVHARTSSFAPDHF